MKKLIALLAIAAFTYQAKAQEVDSRDVPVVVVTAFGTSYPGINDVDWNREGTYYVAEYDDANHQDMYIVYDPMGKLIQTRQRLSKHDLPAALLNYLQSTYKEDELRK